MEELKVSQMGAGGSQKDGEMSYYQQLHPWCIVRWLPNLKRVTVARFRRRNDAEAHLRILRQGAPTISYQIYFDPLLPDSVYTTHARQTSIHEVSR